MGSFYRVRVNILNTLAAKTVMAPCTHMQSRPQDSALSYPSTFLSCTNLASTRGLNLADFWNSFCLSCSPALTVTEKVFFLAPSL